MAKNSTEVPDPAALAGTQWKYDKKALNYGAKINAVDQNTPWGSVSYTRNKNGVPTAVNLTLDRAGKKFYDASNRQRLATLGNLPSGAFQEPNDASVGAVEKALYERRRGLVEPDLQAADDAMRQQLADRGIPIGSEIYNNEWDRLSRNRGNTLAGIAQDATIGAGQESDRLLAHALNVRNQPFNEYASYMSGTPMPSMQIPGSPAYSPQAPDYQGNAWNAYNAQQKQNSGFWNGLFSLGSAAIPFLA